ncbi:MAG TPA: tRNA (adenosine(37)-N6)-threonylcarbamoyltransferase complex dimerization subunit type 1 TsaB [Jiangellaceae bacterium]
MLAFDTSTPAVTVALCDGERVVAESTTVDARRHTELLGPAIVEVLDAAGADRRELTAIAVGVGPGPFTGLRIGLVTARMLGHVLDIPVHGVCSLDVVAHGVHVQAPFVVTTDARRKEVYWAAYDEARRRTAGPAVVAPQTVATELPVAGAGARLYPDAFPNAVPPQFPSATDLAIAVTNDALEVLPPQPIYLRRPDAQPPAGRKPVLSR